MTRTPPSDTEVREIRLAYANTRVTQETLADRFRLSETFIGRVVRGQIRLEAGGPIRDPKVGHAGNYKLSDDQVRALRQAYWEDGVSQAELARRYDITPAHSCNLVHRKRRP